MRNPQPTPALGCCSRPYSLRPRVHADSAVESTGIGRCLGIPALPRLESIASSRDKRSTICCGGRGPLALSCRCRSWIARSRLGGLRPGHLESQNSQFWQIGGPFSHLCRAYAGQLRRIRCLAAWMPCPGVARVQLEAPVPFSSARISTIGFGPSCTAQRLNSPLGHRRGVHHPRPAPRYAVHSTRARRRRGVGSECWERGNSSAPCSPGGSTVGKWAASCHLRGPAHTCWPASRHLICSPEVARAYPLTPRALLSRWIPLLCPFAEGSPETRSVHDP